MRNMAAGFIVLVGVSLASAEDFYAQIMEVQGGKISMKKFIPGKAPEDVTLAASDKIKVLSAKIDPKKKAIEIGGEIEGGLANDVFKQVKVTIIVQVKTDDDKVTQIAIVQPFVQAGKTGPKAEISVVGLLKKVEGNQITLVVGGNDQALTMAEDVKVLKATVKGAKIETAPLEEGLKNEAITSGTSQAMLILDAARKVTEIRVFVK